MAPSPLHGLNIIHAESSPSHDQYADSQDALLANAHFPELAAQLDLWSNLTFQTDEPLVRSDRPSVKLNAEDEGLDDKADDAEVEGPASLDAHVNAVNPTAVANPQLPQQQQQQTQHGSQQHPSYDMASFLSGFGIDPFAVPHVAAPPLPPAASLAQLLAAYNITNMPLFPPAQSPLADVAPARAMPASSLQTQELAKHQTSIRTPAPATATKRAPRTRKTSIAAAPSPVESTEGGDFNETDDPSASNGLSPAEDKRRRNTAASARFRLKKKEREAALERRAQELESRVSGLERECEGLRRENGWLKGLVVGVTGASQGAQVVHSPIPTPATGVIGQRETQASSGAKRKRGNDDKERSGEEKKVLVAA